jgi:hypothetical protein
MIQTESLRIHEIHYFALLNALHPVDGCRTCAAKLLGISLRTVRNWIIKYKKEGRFIPPPPCIHGEHQRGHYPARYKKAY